MYVSLIMCRSVCISVAEFTRKPSYLTCAEDEATAVKVLFATTQPTAESKESTDPRCSLAHDDAVLTPDCSGSCGDHLIRSPSPATSPFIIDSIGSKPVDGDLHRNHTTGALVVERCSSNADPGISGMLTAHSAAGPHVSHVSCGSNDVFVSSSSGDSLSASLVEPLSTVNRSAVLGHDGQDVVLLASNGDDATLKSKSMEANETVEACAPEPLQCVSRPSSVSESESEPLGGCTEALLNPDHCISDLCLEDNDDNDADDSVFAGLQHHSPAATNSLTSHSNADHTIALPVANNSIRRDCDYLSDASQLYNSPFSYLNGFQSPVKLQPGTSAFSRSHMSRSVTVEGSFQSPPRSPVADSTHIDSCSVPLDSSSPFRSPPKLRVSILEEKLTRSKRAAVEDLQLTKMLSFESIETLPSAGSEALAANTGVVINAKRMISYTSSRDALGSELQLAGVPDAAADTLVTVHDEDLLNGITKGDETVVAGSDTVFECLRPSAVSCCEDYKLDWMTESSTATACQSSVVKTVHKPPESDVQFSGVEARCENRNSLPSSPSFEVCSSNRKGRQTSVKQLKCKFESEQDVGSHVDAKSSLNFAVASAESSATYELSRDTAHSSHAQSKELEDTSCSSRSNAVQPSHTKHDSECSSPSSSSKPTRVSMRDFKQCQQPSISARISCFEPVMSVSPPGCQKENKRARLSSFGSAMPDPADTKLSNMSHSAQDASIRSCQKDDSGWFVESPQHSRVRHYQRSSSAGHEDLLALLNIPATSAKHIPRLSERKRMFEMETAKVNCSESTGLIAHGSPDLESGPQRLSSVDKENLLYGYEVNCQGHVNSCRSLFEGNSASTKSDSFYGDSSLEIDCHSFRYPVNRVKTKKSSTDYSIIGSIG